MKTPLSISRVLLCSLAALSAQMILTTYANAQEQIEFFDDFSSDSISYIIDDRPDDRALRSYTVTPDGVEMRVSATGEDQGRAEIWISKRTDSVRTRFSLSSETDIPTDEDGDVKLSISGVWYNEIQDGGLGIGVRTGDVFIQTRLRLRGPDRTEFSLCLDRRLADGSSEAVDIFDGNTDNCTSMSDFVFEFDRVYEVHATLDRTAGTIAFGIDGQEIVSSIGQPIYQPSFNNKQIQLSHTGASGQAVATVSAIGTDGDLQDFSVTPLISGPYRPLFDLERGTGELIVNDGRARFEVSAPADAQERLGLTVFGVSDSIEGVIEISSDSILAESTNETDESFARMRLGGTFYNDTTEGGFNNNEGNVFASINLELRPNDVRELSYCLFRSNTADFTDAIELIMQDGTECGDFGIVPDLDTPYSARINTDLQAGTVTFTVDGVERVHTITTAAFAPDGARQFISAQARASAGSTAIGYLDDYRTSETAPLVAGNSVTNGASDSGGGSGGCSIMGVRGATDLSLVMMACLSGIVCLRRKKASN